jgi:hypothetical protein
MTTEKVVRKSTKTRDISMELLNGLFGGFPQGYERPVVMVGSDFQVSRK